MGKLSNAEHELYKTILNDKELREVMKEKNPNAVAFMAGALLSDWFPRGFIRKLLMLITALAGIVGFAVTNNIWFLVFLLLCLSFSPRMTGYFLLIIGSIQRGFDEGRRK